MKNYMLLLTLFLTIGLIACSEKSEDETMDNDRGAEDVVAKETEKMDEGMDKLFGFESAQIEFLYTGIFEGTETYFIDDWGNTVVIISKKKEFGNDVDKTIIWKDDKTTIHDHIAKTSWSGKIRPKDTEPPAAATTKPEYMEKVGYMKMDDEDIAGKTCTVWDNKNINAKYWIWKGIDLKIENNTVGKKGYIREAISVEEGVNIPDEVLKKPDGYTGR